MSLEARTKGIAARNSSAIDRTEKFRPAELGQLRWEKSLKEVRAGQLPDPRPLDNRTAEAECLAPRYAIFEQHGGGPRKVRIVDDLRASAVNAITDMKDASIPDSSDVFLSAASYFRLIRPACKLRAATADFYRAYKKHRHSIRE